MFFNTFHTKQTEIRRRYFPPPVKALAGPRKESAIEVSAASTADTTTKPFADTLMNEEATQSSVEEVIQPAMETGGTSTTDG